MSHPLEKRVRFEDGDGKPSDNDDDGSSRVSSASDSDADRAEDSAEEGDKSRARNAGDKSGKKAVRVRQADENDRAIVNVLGSSGLTATDAILQRAEETNDEEEEEEDGGDELTAKDDEGASDKTPRLVLLLTLLAHLKQQEQVKTMLARLGADHNKTKEFDAAAEAAHALLCQHSDDVQSRTREYLVREAAVLARRAGHPLASAFLIRWEHCPGVLHGPFTKDAILQWKARGVFAAKRADVVDINVPDAKAQVFIDAASVS